MSRASAVKRLCIVLACASAVVASHEQAAAQYAIITVDDNRTDTRDIVQAATKALLDDAKLDVLGAGDPAAKDVLACMAMGNIDQACVSNAMKMASLAMLVHLRVSHTKDPTGKPVIALTATVFVTDPGDWKEKKAGCTGCYDRDQLSGLVRQVCGPLVHGQMEDTGVLDVRTQPPDARVYLGDTLLGPSGQPYTVPAGKHTIRVDKAGYRSVPVDIEITPGETAIVPIELKRQTAGGNGDNGHDGHDGDSRFGALKWLTAAGGLTFTTLGVVGIAIHDRDRFDGDKLQPDKFRTLPHGIASAAIGAILLGTSVYMFLNDRPVQPDSAATLLLFDDGIGLAVGGVF